MSGVDNSVVADGVDFERLRRRAPNTTQRELIAVATKFGWEVEPRRGKGSHVAVRKAGLTITIPHRPKPGTVRSILKMLENEAAR